MTGVFGGNEFGLISAHFLFISFNRNLGWLALTQISYFRRQLVLFQYPKCEKHHTEPV